MLHRQNHERLFLEGDCSNCLADTDTDHPASAPDGSNQLPQVNA